MSLLKNNSGDTILPTRDSDMLTDEPTRKEPTVMSRSSAHEATTPPIHNGGILHFTVQKVHPVFWPGNTIAGRFEPEMDVRIALVLIVSYNSNKIYITEGPVVITEASTVKGKRIFELTIPDQLKGYSLPMSFKDDYVHIEYRLVGYDLTTNEQIQGHLPIQVMTPIFINQQEYNVFRLEKKLKSFRLFQKGVVKIGIRVDNPELRPGENLSMKLVYNGNKTVRLKRVGVILLRRVYYSICEKSISYCPAKKDTQLNKIKLTLSSTLLNEDQLKIPLSISLPALIPSTSKRETFGNYIRIEYFVILQIKTEASGTKALQIPIHINVGTTAHPPIFNKDLIDMDYAKLQKDENNEHGDIYGVIFNRVSSPWPTERDETEEKTISVDNVSKVSCSTANTEEKSNVSIGSDEGGEASSGDAFSVTTQSVQNSLRNFTVISTDSSSTCISINK